jgi:hypothetical protein
MSDAADRVRHYCARARYSRSDFCDEARYLAPELRKVVWNDREIRTVLLAAGEDRKAWDALLGQVGHERGLALLDLVSAMALESRTSSSSSSSCGRT